MANHSETRPSYAFAARRPGGTGLHLRNSSEFLECLAYLAIKSPCLERPVFRIPAPRQCNSRAFVRPLSASRPQLRPTAWLACRRSLRCSVLVRILTGDGVNGFQVCGKAEGASSLAVTFHPDSAAHHFNQLGGDR
jgi:hypothetical protein